MTANTVLQFYPADNLPHMLRIAIRILGRMKERQSSSVLLVPFFSEALAFRINDALRKSGMEGHFDLSVPATYQQPELTALLTLLLAGQPDFRLTPARIAQMLHTAIPGCDPIRAQIVANHLVKETSWIPFSQLPPRIQQRMGQPLQADYDRCIALAIALSQLQLDDASESVLAEISRLTAEYSPQIGTPLAIGLLDITRIAQETPANSMLACLHSITNGAPPRTTDLPLAFAASILVTSPDNFLDMNYTTDEQIWFDGTHPIWSRHRANADLLHHLIQKSSRAIHLIANRKTFAVPERSAPIRALGLPIIEQTP